MYYLFDPRNNSNILIITNKDTINKILTVLKMHVNVSKRYSANDGYYNRSNQFKYQIENDVIQINSSNNYDAKEEKSIYNNHDLPSTSDEFINLISHFDVNSMTKEKLLNQYASFVTFQTQFTCLPYFDDETINCIFTYNEINQESKLEFLLSNIIINNHIEIKSCIGIINNYSKQMKIDGKCTFMGYKMKADILSPRKN